MTLLLRPYQEGLLGGIRTELRTHRRAVLQSPTGSGKTVLTTHMIRGAAAKGLRSWFVVHRRELLDQTSRALWAAGVQHGNIAAGRPLTSELVQVASVQTLARRMDRLTPPDFLIIDEAHHAVAATYRRVLDRCPRSWVVGLTATPERTDGAGLGDLFDGLVLGPSVADLIEQGYLSRYRIVAPPAPVDVGAVRVRGGDFVRGELAAIVDQRAIIGDAVEHYRRYVGSREGPPSARSCLVYCVSRAHARNVAATYRAAGIDAVYVGGDTPDAERNAAIAGFRRGAPTVIVSVDLFGEGLDCPGLAAVQLLRPTQSLSLHLQQLGRALRVEPGKETAVLLDHVGNSWRHGLPDDEREWSLEGRPRRKKGEEEVGSPLVHCEGCHAVFRAHLPSCPVCGIPRAVAERRDAPDQVEGSLQEVDPEQHRRERRREEGRAQTLEDLVRLGRSRGYKPSWAGIRWAARTGMDRAEAVAEAYRMDRGMGGRAA